jgi:hypothetical protein
LLEQKGATPERLVQCLKDWLQDAKALEHARDALARWHTPDAADRIADVILGRIAERNARGSVRAGAGQSSRGSECGTGPGRGSRLEVSA